MGSLRGPQAASRGTMTRGNQRETDRARAAKRNAGKGVKASDKDGLTASQRKERDALALQEKQKKKEEAAKNAGKCSRLRRCDLLPPPSAPLPAAGTAPSSR